MYSKYAVALLAAVCLVGAVISLLEGRQMLQLERQYQSLFQYVPTGETQQQSSPSGPSSSSTSSLENHPQATYVQKSPRMTPERLEQLRGPSGPKPAVLVTVCTTGASLLSVHGVYYKRFYLC